MFTRSIRLPATYIDAKHEIEQSLSANNSLVIKSYGSILSHPCVVSHFHVDEVFDKEGFANLEMTITYHTQYFNADNSFYTVEKVRNLRVLNTAGDNLWTFNMINLFWDGDYPSTVAFDVNTAEIFFLHIKANRIELVEFGVFDKEYFEAITHELNDREPFAIKIDETAMFEFIDGSEGRNRLKDRIFIQFNCSAPFRIYHKNQTYC